VCGLAQERDAVARLSPKREEKKKRGRKKASRYSLPRANTILSHLLEGVLKGVKVREDL